MSPRRRPSPTKCKPRSFDQIFLVLLRLPAHPRDRCRVARHEAKKRQQAYDSHNDYHLRAAGSVEAMTNEYLFKT